MRMVPGTDDIFVTTKQLWSFAWSAPMHSLAADIGISDVGLKKLLQGHGVTCPPQGYWNRVRAGKRVPERPCPPPRRAGQSERMRLDARFTRVMEAAPAPPSTGPFVSALVPEDLEELRARELKAIGRVPAPRDLKRPHPALLPLLQRDEKRRKKLKAQSWVAARRCSTRRWRSASSGS